MLKPPLGKGPAGGSVAKSTLDKDLKKVVRIETATPSLSRPLATPGLLAVFLLGTIAVASLSIGEGPLGYFVILACGRRRLYGAQHRRQRRRQQHGPGGRQPRADPDRRAGDRRVCEAAGAILAGGDVTTTVARDIIRGRRDEHLGSFILVMIAALLAAAMWIHLATILGAPVSTTHSVVGGVVGAGARGRRRRARCRGR